MYKDRCCTIGDKGLKYSVMVLTGSIWGDYGVECRDDRSLGEAGLNN